MLQLSRVQELFNPALKPNHKLWDDLIEEYIHLNFRRLTDIRWPEYQALSAKKQEDARRKARARLLQHMGEIVQRRHDIVHNCDRPKSAKQKLTLAATEKMLKDVQVFVAVLDCHVDAHRMYS